MKKTLPLLALLCISGSALAQNGPGSFYTNLGATAISDGSDSETAYFAQLGYNYYLSPMVSLDLSFGHTATLDSTVTSESDGFASKYNSYSAGLKLEQSFGGFNSMVRAVRATSTQRSHVGMQSTAYPKQQQTAVSNLMRVQVSLLLS